MAHLEEALYRIKELSREKEELVDLLEEVFWSLTDCDPEIEQKVLTLLDKEGALQ